MKSNQAQLYEKGFKAELLYAELENTLHIVTFAEYVHHLYDSAAAMSAEEKASVVAEIHPNLRIERNKIHSMTESFSDIARIPGN